MGSGVRVRFLGEGMPQAQVEKATRLLGTDQGLNSPGTRCSQLPSGPGLSHGKWWWEREEQLSCNQAKQEKHLWNNLYCSRN